MEKLLEFLNEHREDMVNDLRKIVELESPSTDKRLLDGALAFIVSYIKENTGGDVEIIPNRDAGNHLIAHFGPDIADKPILILTHYDTVWPEGTLKDMPFNREGRKITGPGVFDMKGGLIQGLWAIRALEKYNALTGPVVLLCTSDEEIGSSSSRKLIEETAANSRCVLVLEASEKGALKTARKGVGDLNIEVIGKAAHAGLDPENGISAIVELSRIVLELQDLNDPESGTTVNVGTIKGGTRRNVVPAHAEAVIDLRVSSSESAEAVLKRIRSIEPDNPDARVNVTGGINRPPMERTHATADLFFMAREGGKKIGLELEECSVGGASDGNFCAALGIPVLDGLGAVGSGAHAPEEHLIEETMPQRAALLAMLIADLQNH